MVVVVVCRGVEEGVFPACEKAPHRRSFVGEIWSGDLDSWVWIIKLW